MEQYVDITVVPDLPCDPATLEEHITGLKPSEQTDTDIVSLANKFRGSYVAPETDDAVATLTPVGTLNTEFRTEFATIHTALTDYVKDLKPLKEARTALIEEITTFRSDTNSWAARKREADATLANLTDEELLIQEGGPRRHFTNDDLLSRSAALERDIQYAGDFLDTDLSSLDGPSTHLPSGSRTQAERFDANYFNSSRESEFVWSLLNALEKGAGQPPTADGLAKYLESHPEIIDQLNKSVAPEEVSDWWSEVKQPGNEGLYAALAAGATTLVGNLGGIPPLDRVEINKITAQKRLDEVTKSLSLYPYWTGKGTKIDAPDSLIRERDYLNAVMTGERKLYAFDPLEQPNRRNDR